MAAARPLRASHSAPSFHRLSNGRSHRRGSRTSADDLATTQRLHNILLQKFPDESDLDSEVASRHGGSSVAGSGRGSSSPKVIRPSIAKVEPPLVSVEINDKDKEAFVDQICTDATRFEVSDWVGKIYEMKVADEQKQLQAAAARRRRLRSSCGGSDSGASGAHSGTALSGTVSHTVSQGVSQGPSLLTAGGSIANISFRTGGQEAAAASVISDESLAVHCTGDNEILTLDERWRHYLENRIPELSDYVRSQIIIRTEALRQQVDEQVKQQRLNQMMTRRVFDMRTNQLRWENARRRALQQELDRQMSSWILEAIDNWDQVAAYEGRKEISETSTMYDILTKRSAHMDSGNLALEIPLFQTMRPSYALFSEELWG